MKIHVSASVEAGVEVEVNPDHSLTTIYKRSRQYIPVLYLYGEQLPIILVAGGECFGHATPSDRELMNMSLAQFCGCMGIAVPKWIFFKHAVSTFSRSAGILHQGKYTFTRVDGGYNIICRPSDAVIGFAESLDKAKEFAIRIEREKENNTLTP